MKKIVFLGVFVAGVVLFGSCGGGKSSFPSNLSLNALNGISVDTLRIERMNLTQSSIIGRA